MSNAMTIDDKLAVLWEQYQQVDEQIALLSALAIARTVHEALPQATAVGFYWSDQGPYLTVDGYFTADGTRIEEFDGIDYPEDLDDALWPYCLNLAENNQATWGPFTDAGPDGISMRLKINDVLALEEPDIQDHTGRLSVP